MAIFSKFINGMIYKGGFVAAGVACFALAKTEYLPSGAVTASYGMAATGLVGFIFGLVTGRVQRSNEDTVVDLEANVVAEESSEESSEEENQEENQEEEKEEEEEVEEEDPDHEARMAEFNDVRPLLVKHIDEQNELFAEYQRLRKRFAVLDEMERISLEFDYIISEFERRHKARLMTDEVAVDRVATVDRAVYKRRRGVSFNIKNLALLSRYYIIF